MYGDSINLTEDCMLYGKLWTDEVWDLDKCLEMLYKHSIELGMSIDEVEDMLNWDLPRISKYRNVA